MKSSMFSSSKVGKDSCKAGRISGLELGEAERDLDGGDRDLDDDVRDVIAVIVGQHTAGKF